MADSEDHIALAAEYALGTLDAEERAQAEAMMTAEPDFAAMVQAWEFRLGSLNQMVGTVEPRPVVWENIKTALGLSVAAAPPLVVSEPVEPGPTALDVVPSESSAPELQAPEPVTMEHASSEASVEPPSPPAPPLLVREAEIRPAPVELRRAPVIEESNVVDFASRAKRWRGIASAVSALAAMLLVTVGLQIFAPDALPQAFRAKPRIQTVEVKVPQPALASSAQYVALLQSPGGGPAFILTIDGATKNFTVRKVGDAAEPGKSFELWLISDKLPQPRSLGVIGSGDFTARPVLASYAPDVINGATYAVTVEQAGGSPNGQPTSAPILTGKLIETVPGAGQK